jgi:xylan 1,4-beta-xylosidase
MDLVNWTLVARPLNRAALLDMRGNPNICGVWVPCLSHADGKSWLVYNDVKRLEGDRKDAHNYITTCDTIDGDWTDPWCVNPSGFDPSLFHDDDGRKWLANMQWNHRAAGTGVNPAYDRVVGFLLQEWSPEHGLFGPAINIYTGTGYDHAVTLARSRQIAGPYETHPKKHVMSTQVARDHPIQRTGHGQYVGGPDGMS